MGAFRVFPGKNSGLGRPMTDKKILVVLDPTAHQQPALDRATDLAEQLSMHLELFVCYYDADIAAGRISTLWIEKPAREQLMAIIEKKLEALAAPLRERGIEVSSEVAWDHPLDDGIVRKILASEPWMVVKDTHHHNVLKRTILSNTDWSLIRRCPAPLLLVKLDPTSVSRKICAAIDPMHEHDKPAELDDAIFRMAATLAEATDAELHVVHTFAVRAEPVGLEAPPVGKISEAVEQEHKKAFAEFLSAHPILPANAHLLEGVPYERLMQFTVKEGIGIIVMGAISRSALGRVFIGSTAERVLDRLPCDLLIIKPDRLRSTIAAGG
jgi:universal stress protein E